MVLYLCFCRVNHTNLSMPFIGQDWYNLEAEIDSYSPTNFPECSAATIPEEYQGRDNECNVASAVPINYCSNIKSQHVGSTVSMMQLVAILSRDKGTSLSQEYALRRANGHMELQPQFPSVLLFRITFTNLEEVMLRSMYHTIHSPLDQVTIESIHLLGSVPSLSLSIWCCIKYLDARYKIS